GTSRVARSCRRGTRDAERRSRPPDRGRCVRARVLIVEAEPVLASGIRRLLLLHGFEIAGCAGSVKTGLALLEQSDCDIALLDVNLRGESVVPVAEALRLRGRPFVLMS